MSEPAPTNRKARALFLSVKDLLLRAAVVTIFFGAAHFLGLRQYTSFISGTSADPSLSPVTVGFLGLSYLVLYFAFILAVPIFLIAAGLLALWERLGR